MQTLLPRLWSAIMASLGRFAPSTRCLRHAPVRPFSLNSAIERGIRQSGKPRQQIDYSDEHSKRYPETTHYKPPPPSSDHPSSSPRTSYDVYRPSTFSSNSRRTLPRFDSPIPPAEWTKTPRHYIPKVHDGSEWIYGTSVVEAALKSRRRKSYRLYIYSGENRTVSKKEQDAQMKNLAKQNGVEVVEMMDLGKLESMSSSRPHNGYVLECDPIPKIPILNLNKVEPNRESFKVQLAQHTSTEFLIINHQNDTIICRDPTRRFPFVLMLDEILDPGNMGAIIRSAYYLGVDAICVSAKNCAPLTPSCIKSSAGAAEIVPIFEQTRGDRFITNSIENGWTFYAAIPPPSSPGTTKKPGSKGKYVSTSQISKAVETGPVVLVLGSEGEGLRTNLTKLVKYFVTIEKAPGTDPLVDSLNVSVASALLCAKFLQL